MQSLKIWNDIYFLVSPKIILQHFDAVGWATGMASDLKSSATTIPKSLLLGTGLNWSILMWNNSGKKGQLNKNHEYYFSEH